jgi:hypothetical protein
MKKLALVFSALIFIMTSCSVSSSDDPIIDPPVTNGIKLIKELVTVDGVETTSNITYSGNKLVSALEVGGYKTNYTYTGDFITKIELFRTDETIQSRYEYTYSNGKNTELITTRWSNGSITVKYKNVYTYLANGNINFTQKGLDFVTNEPTSSPGLTGTYTYTNGNCISKTLQTNTGTPLATSYSITIAYTYDTKKIMLTNVLNYNKLVNEEEFSSTNNPLSITETQTGYSPKTITTTNTYTYNSDSFPITKSEVYTRFIPASGSNVFPPSAASTITETRAYKYFYE